MGYSLEDECTGVEDLQCGESSIPEIVTPQRVVKSMIDMLPRDVWNKETKFLDMACKGGEYLRKVYDRLMETDELKVWFPNIIERSNHILKNQIYGIALSEVSLARTTKKLLGEDRNLRVIDNYIKILRGKERKANVRVDIADVLKGAFGENMRFDVVIGNPPYNESDGGGDENRQSSKPLHSEFVNAALETVKPKYLSFVMPCRWYVENDKYNKRIREQLFNGELRELHDFEDASNVFNGVDIIGGVCYFLHEKGYHGETNITLHGNEEIEFTKRLENGSYFYRSKVMAGVIEKVQAHTSSYISDCVLTTGPFGFKRADRGSEIKYGDNNIKLIGANKEETYVSLSDVSKNDDKVELYKVCTGYMHGMDSQVIDKAWLMYPNEVCTLTYMVVACYKSLEEAQRCIKYINSKFVRALVKITHTKLGITAENWRLVPLPNVSNTSDIGWSGNIREIDEQLYRKYGLSDEEIDYIEETIKYID